MTEQDDFEFETVRIKRLIDFRNYYEEMYYPYKQIDNGEIIKMLSFILYPVKEICPSCGNDLYLFISGICKKCEDKY